jgi:hypothetical protein
MKEINMNKIVMAAALLLLTSGPLAIAQTGQGAGGSSSSSARSSGGVISAPVGHRQPRRSDVASEKDLSNPNDAVNREDAALDRKIKSICRGC